MRPGHNRQRDLFEPDREIHQQIPVTLKRELVRLIKGLLVEALGNGGGRARVAIAETQEGAHDQDHA
jgi:hypothetical protein